jgi:hypothetical protein
MEVVVADLCDSVCLEAITQHELKQRGALVSGPGPSNHKAAVCTDQNYSTRTCCGDNDSLKKTA